MNLDLGGDAECWDTSRPMVKGQDSIDVLATQIAQKIIDAADAT